jgi:hypothetical protein
MVDAFEGIAKALIGREPVHIRPHGEIKRSFSSSAQ